MFTIKCSESNSFRSKFVSKTTFCKDTFFREKEIGNHKSMKSSFVLFFFLMSLHVWGQNWCDPTQRPSGTGSGGFTVKGSAVGCLPSYDVAVKPTVAGTSIQYIYDYKGGDPVNKTLYSPTADSTHRYTKLGKYTILQLVSVGGTGAVACLVVEAVTAPNYKVQTCSGRRVVVTIADDSTTKGYESFMVNFGGGVFMPVSKANAPYTISYDYPATSNAATISVTGVAPGNVQLTCKKDTSVVLNSASASVVSIRKVTTLPNGTVNVLVKNSLGVKSDVQIDEGATGTFKNTGQSVTASDTITVTILNINAAQNAYCFRLGINDGCANTVTYSNVVCATSLDVVAQNKQNVLTWKEYPQTQASQFQNYQISRDSRLLQQVSNRTTLSYTDRDIVCGVQYYYVVTLTLANGAEVVSQAGRVTAISDDKPSAVTGSLVSVEDGQKSIEISANQPTNSVGILLPQYKTIIFRADNGSSDFKQIATIKNSTSYVDQQVNPLAQSYCYKIQFQNSCGNLSELSEPVCTIHLYSKTNSTVDWTADSPFQSDVQRYVLEVYDENDVLYEQTSLGGATSFNPEQYNPDQQQFKYRILAYSQERPGVRSSISYSNYYVFLRNALVFIPDAFSPNKDNINDSFAIKGQFVNTSKMFIYNRWGEAIYESEDAINKGWNGRLGSKNGSEDSPDAPEGSYVYRVEVKDLLGKEFVKVGTFLLVR